MLLVACGSDLDTIDTIELYISNDDTGILISNAQLTFKALGINVHIDENTSLDAQGRADQFIKADRKTNVNVAFVISTADYKILLEGNKKTDDMVMVCVASKVGDDYHGVVFHRDFIEAQPVKVALFVAAILKSNEEVESTNDIVAVERNLNFVLFGILPGNTIGSPDPTFSNLAVNPVPLNTLTNPPIRKTTQLKPIFNISGKDVYDSVTLCVDDTLSARVENIPSEGEVNFCWYDGDNNEERTLITIGDNFSPTKEHLNIDTVYVEVTHTIRDRFGNTSTTGSNSIKVTIYEESLPVSTVNLPKNPDGDPTGVVEIKAIEETEDGVRKSLLTITIPMNVDKINITRPDSQIFSYQWYQLNDEGKLELRYESYECIIDISEPGTFNYLLITAIEGINVAEEEIRIIVTREPEKPNITIRQIPENIMINDPSEITLIAETSIDQLALNNIVEFAYKWYESDAPTVVIGTERELKITIPTNEESKIGFYAEITVYDSRATTETKEVFVRTNEHIVIINKLGETTEQINFSFAGSTIELDENEKKKIKDEFNKYISQHNIKEILSLEVGIVATGVYLENAEKRCNEVDKFFKELIRTSGIKIIKIKDPFIRTRNGNGDNGWIFITFKTNKK